MVRRGAPERRAASPSYASAYPSLSARATFCPRIPWRPDSVIGGTIPHSSSRYAPGWSGWGQSLASRLSSTTASPSGAR
jgi:hypothetical protein